MRYLAALAGALLLAGCAASKEPVTAARPAETPDICRAETAPAIDVSFGSETAPEDHSQSARDLTALEAAKKGKAVTNPVDVVVLYDTRIESTITLQGTTRPLASGANCLWLTSAHVAVQRKNHISIASEFTQGSCADAIMRRKAADMLASADSRDEQLKQKIKDAMTSAGHDAVTDATLAGAQKKLEQSLSDAVNAQVQDEATVENASFEATSKVNVLKDVTAQCHDPATRHLLQALASS